MRLNKDDIYSLIGTVAFHGVILLILWFTVLKTEVPDEDGGVLVNFGNVDAAAGMFEPKYTGQEPPQETTTPPPPVPEPQVETPKQELITQDIEESVALEDAKKKKEEEKKSNVWVWVLAIVGGIAVIAGIAYAVYRYLTPDYMDDFDDDFDDDLEDDFFDDEDEEPEKEEKKPE